MKAIVIACSHHQGNTEKVARRIAQTLGARVAAPDQLDPAELAEYDLLGFGSGIYDGKHHEDLLAFADRLPDGQGKKAFLFSTDGVPRFAMKNPDMLRRKMDTDHADLREKLLFRTYILAGEFNCPGLNTNSFMKWFGGCNKGRPDQADLEQAAEFARGLLDFSQQSS